MRIGIVSDTHNNLKNVKRIVELFNENNVDRVIHTGDISQAKTIDVLADLNAPVYGVFGNNDQGELIALTDAVNKHGFHFIQPPLVLSWANKQIVVVHDPLELAMIDPGGFDVILHGHTHRQTIHYEKSQLTFNPGECAGMMTGSNAIGILDLVAMQPEIVKF